MWDMAYLAHLFMASLKPIGKIHVDPFFTNRDQYLTHDHDIIWANIYLKGTLFPFPMTYYER